MKKEDELILRRLREVNESVNLGTLDTSIFGLMIFIFATALSILSILPNVFPKLINEHPHFLVVVVVSLFAALFLFQPIIFWFSTIISKKGRFSNKKKIIVLLSIEILFLVFFSLVVFIEWICSIFNSTLPSWFGIILIIFSFVVSVFLGLNFIKPEVDKYFNENFNFLIERRKKELNSSRKI